MSARKQAEKQTTNGHRANGFARRAKKALIDRNLSVTALAIRIKKRRDSVSTSIHTDRFPKVREKVAAFLGL